MKKAVNAKVAASAKSTSKKVATVKSASKGKKTPPTKKDSDNDWWMKPVAAKTRKAQTPQVICAFAEKSDGPGWGNQPVWVIISDENGVLRKERLPGKHSAEIAALYNVCYEAHFALTAAVKKALAAPETKKAKK